MFRKRLKRNVQKLKSVVIKKSLTNLVNVKFVNLNQKPCTTSTVSPFTTTTQTSTTTYSTATLIPASEYPDHETKCVDKTVTATVNNVHTETVEQTQTVVVPETIFQEKVITETEHVTCTQTQTQTQTVTSTCHETVTATVSNVITETVSDVVTETVSNVVTATKTVNDQCTSTGKLPDSEIKPQTATPIYGPESTHEYPQETEEKAYEDSSNDSKAY